MLPSKKEIFHAALDQPGGLDGKVLVTLLTSVPGVAVGDFIGDVSPDGLLRLNFSMRFGEQLDTDDKGIRGTLSRRGQTTPVFIPWAAVVGITEHSTGNGLFFQYSDPVEAKVEATIQAPPRPRGLRLVKNEEN